MLRSSSALAFLLLFALLPGTSLHAQDSAMLARWRINESQSDNTDSKVEKALRKAGEKIKSSWFDRRKDKYRGGPADQELYDRFSYDTVLTITRESSGYVFEFADNYKARVYTDNRSHSVSLNALESSEDFLEGRWEGQLLKVDMHPRDGGYAYATYEVKENGKKLYATYLIKPGSFTEEFELERVYDRVP